ncbi:MAG TPA: hypothetical protein VJ984_08300, partial [Xanthomonadales bacterium]|nr:hypothetical protein [Xanthomonadales bacterium]
EMFMKKFFGLLFLLAAIPCGYGTYLSSGGMHGWSGFEPERILSPTGGRMLLSATITCIIFGVCLLLMSKNKEEDTEK